MQTTSSPPACDDQLPEAFLLVTVQRLEAIFHKCDLDHNGFIDSDELRVALQKLLLPCTERDMDTLFGGGDGHPYGLSERVFAKYCFNAEQHLWKMFKSLDLDGDGTIDREEFRKSLPLLGYRWKDAEVDHVFTQLDLAKDGRLRYEEWRRLLAYPPPEGKAWVDCFYRMGMSSEGVLGDNLRPLRQRGDPRALDLFAGFVAGTVSRTVTAPAERIKTELQLSTERVSLAATVRKTMASGGVRAFFQGNLTNCLKVAPQSSLFFALTDHFKRTLPTRGDPSVAQVHSFLSGTCAGLLSQFIVYPLEPIKTCLTVAPLGRYRSMFHCASEMVREQGFQVLYRGALPTMAGCIPYAGLQRWSYDWLQMKYVAFARSDKPCTSAAFGCGLVSSCIGMTASYPLVIIRTRLQMQGIGGRAMMYTGVYDCFTKTLQREGVRGLFKGLGANTIKSAPAAAINFALYDRTKDLLKELWLRRGA
mmetsp:Transcript_19064/g.44538  ORF Transcript_19064/g.44538 Transcript_19064/m.44538 type:complete len:476 (-) Transcript_19064:62-1489(-)